LLNPQLAKRAELKIRSFIYPEEDAEKVGFGVDRFPWWLNRVLKKSDCGSRREGPGAKARCIRWIFRRAKEGAEKVPCAIKSVPQRLKPRCEQSTFGTAEAVPLSKTDFFSTL
jgi:hypothetical protein